jgi:nicotinamide-nucleotide amidase
MIGEIIAIGNELTSGRVLNTTSRYAARLLYGVGHEISAMTTIGDAPADIGKTLRRAVRRSEFVIVTGGLGATSDDLTNESAGKGLGSPVVFHPEVFDRIKARYQHLDEATTRSLKRLAMLPAGAEILHPEGKMAGYLLVHESKPLFFLPGVPHEMEELLQNIVIPKLAARQPAGSKQVRQRVFKVFGLGETEINHRIGHLEKETAISIRIGYYPVFPEVHLSLAVAAVAADLAETTLHRFAGEVQQALGDALYGINDDTMASVTGQLLQVHGKMLATAESCTGGLIGSKITAVPGSSEYFAGGAIAYSNGLKEKFLGVDPALLVRHGAVSPEVAEAMADNIRSMTAADIGLAVTGIAGPAGGTPEKPVGTVFIGLSSQSETIVTPCRFAGERWQVQELTAVTALDLIRRFILENTGAARKTTM